MTERLKLGAVLWLVSGGSAIQVAVAAATKLAGFDLHQLTVSLVDERFGPAGHENSNWRQLTESGFKLAGANLQPILVDKDIKDTTADYEKFIGAHISDYKLALLGMGADGHTAGILPNSPALHQTGRVCFYEGPDYQRITLTPNGLEMLDEAVMFAVGDNKRQAVENLSREISVEKQPAQIIKRIPRWSVYNDLRGEEL